MQHIYTGPVRSAPAPLVTRVRKLVLLDRDDTFPLPGQDPEGPYTLWMCALGVAEVHDPLYGTELPPLSHLMDCALWPWSAIKEVHL
jgi:hypothetical protein